MKKNSVKIKALLGLLLLCAGAHFFWISSPTYAIREFDRALREKDLATVYSRLDLDRIYDSCTDALLARTLTDADSAWQRVQSSASGGISKALKSQYIDTIKRDIELRFRGAAPLDAQPVSLLKEFLLDIQEIGFGRVVRTGEGALVNVEPTLRKMAKSYPLILRMERKGLWKITGFEALASTLAQYEVDRARKLEAFNSESARAMEAKLPFFGQIRSEEALGGLQKTVHFEFIIKNTTTSPLRSLRGQLTAVDAKGATLARESFEQGEINLPAGEKRAFLLPKDLGLFNSVDLSQSGIVLHFHFEEAVFAGGETLRLAKSYSDL